MKLFGSVTKWKERKAQEAAEVQVKVEDLE